MLFKWWITRKRSNANRPQVNFCKWTLPTSMTESSLTAKVGRSSAKAALSSRWNKLYALRFRSLWDSKTRTAKWTQRVQMMKVPRGMFNGQISLKRRMDLQIPCKGYKRCHPTNQWTNNPSATFSKQSRAAWTTTFPKLSYQRIAPLRLDCRDKLQNKIRLPPLLIPAQNDSKGSNRRIWNKRKPFSSPMVKSLLTILFRGLKVRL